jgi:hypothetical protein
MQTNRNHCHNRRIESSTQYSAKATLLGDGAAPGQEGSQDQDCYQQPLLPAAMTDLLGRLRRDGQKLEKGKGLFFVFIANNR